ncbi:damage-inducible protein CinA [Bifidobacterium xylocopae]|uniref:Damage-inducible protein CinA n=2 Tax=Bifidobacterium xylocopae TaxID=2493119 RepID=A0A366KCU2_9BIFI|nr:damage-inducible protein CinA [Bifidobacterium xylocopae]
MKGRRGETATASGDDRLARRILDRCRDLDLLLAASESLTGGLMADAFVRVPGASDVFLGSAVTYDIEAKASVLGVTPGLLAEHGAVHPRVAQEMALGAARLYTQPGHEGRVLGLSTTGVAGPGPDNGRPAGLVYVAIAVPDGVLPGDALGGLALDGYHLLSYELHLPGSRERVRRGTVRQLLVRLDQLLAPRKLKA